MASDAAPPPPPVTATVKVQSLVPPEGLSLSAAALWLLPRLLSRGLLSSEEHAALKLVVLRGESGVLAPLELYALAVKGSSEESKAGLSELVSSLKLVAAHALSLHSDTAEVVHLRGSSTTEDGAVYVPRIPSSASFGDITGLGLDLEEHDEDDAEGGPSAAPRSIGGLGSSVGSLGALSAGGESMGAGAVAGAGGTVRLETVKVKDSTLRSVSTPGRPSAVLVRKDIIIMYYASEMKSIAERIEKIAGGRVLLQEVRWDRFADGFPNLFLTHVKNVRYHDVVFLASLHNLSTIFEQVSVMHALPRYLARTFSVFVPFYPTGTMERIDSMGQVATAASLARILSTTPAACNGPSRLCIFDIHALSELFFFGDNILVRLKSCISLLKARLHTLPDFERVVIAFPDEGAYKRFHNKFTAFETIICEKRRVEGGGRIVTIKEGNASGKHVVIVDDLVQSGGTLIECAKGVVKAGATSVSCYVTHAVFPNDSWMKFVDHPDVTFSHVWVTNTIPTTTDKLLGVKPFEVLSIAPVILSAIQ